MKTMKVVGRLSPNHFTVRSVQMTENATEQPGASVFPILDHPSTRDEIDLGVFAWLCLDPAKWQRRRLVQLLDEVPLARVAGSDPVLLTQVLNDSRTVQSDLKLVDIQLAEKVCRRWSGLSKSDYRDCLVLIHQ